MTPEQMKIRDAALLKIAKNQLDLNTLDASECDPWEFPGQSVCDIREALETAYAAGRASL